MRAGDLGAVMVRNLSAVAKNLSRNKSISSKVRSLRMRLRFMLVKGYGQHEKSIKGQ
jgi:hypothetical protein